MLLACLRARACVVHANSQPSKQTSNPSQPGQHHKLLLVCATHKGCTRHGKNNTKCRVRTRGPWKRPIHPPSSSADRSIDEGGGGGCWLLLVVKIKLYGSEQRAHDMCTCSVTHSLKKTGSPMQHSSCVPIVQSQYVRTPPHTLSLIHI